MASRVTGKALIEFWQSPLVETRVGARAAADLATACREVLSAQDQLDQINIRTNSLEEILEAYTKSRSGVRPQTLAAYKSRFRKAVRLFLNYLDDADNWYVQANLETSAPIQKAESQLQRYRFPLRESQVVDIELPIDLTMQEANRLNSFIHSLVITSLLG